MAKDYASQARGDIRRSDRAVQDDAWIQVFLQNAPIGTLVTVHDGQPYVNTNLFLYDAETHSIILHTASVGRTRANIEANPAQPVTFTIHEMGRLLPAKEALEFSVEYAGVVVFGTLSMIDDEQEAIHALELIMAKYASHLRAGHDEVADYRPPVTEELKRTSVFRLKIDEWTAKKKEVDGHQGAYWYDERPILRSVRTRPSWRGRVASIQIAPVEGQALQFPDRIEASAGRGLIGEHHCAPDPMPIGERRGADVTLIAMEDVEALQVDGIHITPADTRRNIVTQGLPLTYLVGKRFRVGGAILEGHRLCEPCKTLVDYTGQGNQLIQSMLHRGGLRANVVRSGIIHKGDAIILLEEAEA